MKLPFFRENRYVYGYVVREEDNHVAANVRLDTKTNRLYTLLWKPGEQGHQQGYWQEMGQGWIHHFKRHKE